MEYRYDNSTSNPRNPEHPPRRARWGQRSSDEMGDLWIQVLTGDEPDLVTLTREFRAKVAAEDVIGYEMEIDRLPDDPGLHDDAALLYLELGRPERAVADSRELRPGDLFFGLRGEHADGGEFAALAGGFLRRCRRQRAQVIRRLQSAHPRELVRLVELLA